MSSTLNGLNISVIYPLPFTSEEWDKPRIGRWITANGGTHVSNRFTPNTTHLVCSELHWKIPSRHPAVQVALEAIKCDGHAVKIVNCCWLEDALAPKSGTGVCNPRPTQYLWETIEAEAANAEKCVGVGARKADKAKVGECGEGPSPWSHQSVVTEVLEQSPEELVSEEVKREIETEGQAKKKVTVDAMRKEERMTGLGKERKRKAAKEHMVVLENEVRKTRNEIFSGEYSCLLDDDGRGMG